MSININFDSLVAWLKSKNITAHSIAVGAIALATLYTTDQQVRDFVLALVKDHPKIAADISLAVAVILKYSHSSSDAGTVANAKVIEASPNPPTATAVEAATPKPTQP
jgi:hypothetical protein